MDFAGLLAALLNPADAVRNAAEHAYAEALRGDPSTVRALRADWPCVTRGARPARRWALRSRSRTRADGS